MPEIILNRAVRADFADIARLHAASWRSAYSNHLPRSYLESRVEDDLNALWAGCKIGKDDIVLLARDRASQALLGFISVWCRPRPFIDHLHCDPSNTGRGIGGLLLRESFYHLDKNGYQDVYLTVLVGNDRARRFYLRKGAEPDKVSREWIFQYPVDVETLKWTNIGNQL